MQACHDFMGALGVVGVGGCLFFVDVTLITLAFSSYGNGGNIFAPASDNHTCRVLMMMSRTL